MSALTSDQAESLARILYAVSLDVDSLVMFALCDQATSRFQPWIFDLSTEGRYPEITAKSGAICVVINGDTADV